MDNRKTIFRFILAALLIFMIFSFLFAMFNTPISNVTRSILAISGDIKIKKIEYNPAAEDLAKDKKRVEMTKRMSIPVPKKAGTTTAAAAPAKPVINRTAPPKNGFYIQNPANEDSKAILKIDSKDQVTLNPDAWNGPKDSQANCVFLKDSTGITITVNVQDNKLIAESATPWQNDAVEFYFDFRSASSRGKEQFEKGVFQIIAIPCFSKTNPDTLHFYNSNSGYDVTVKGAKIKSEKTSSGYRVKVFLPMEGLKGIGVTPEKEFNFDFGILDVDDAETPQKQLLWSGAPGNSNSAKWYGHMAPLE